MRSDDQGIIWKAYSNNGVPISSRTPLERSRVNDCAGSGERVRRFGSDARYTIHYQYTDTSAGTYWCATFVESENDDSSACHHRGGTRFEDAKWFRGWNTDRSSVSQCPDGDCCRTVSDEMAERWNGNAWPSVRPNSHVLAAMPVETIPGVDMVEIYEFLTDQDDAAFQ